MEMTSVSFCQFLVSTPPNSLIGRLYASKDEVRFTDRGVEAMCGMTPHGVLAAQMRIPPAPPSHGNEAVVLDYVFTYSTRCLDYSDNHVAGHNLQENHNDSSGR